MFWVSKGLLFRFKDELTPRSEARGLLLPFHRRGHGEGLLPLGSQVLLQDPLLPGGQSQPRLESGACIWGAACPSEGADHLLDSHPDLDTRLLHVLKPHAKPGPPPSPQGAQAVGLWASAVFTSRVFNLVCDCFTL